LVNPFVRTVLLPGLDGTGHLFAPLLEALPRLPPPIVVEFPRREVVSLFDLCALIRRRLPVGEPFVLIAESFSGPLALRVAAENPPFLRAVVLAASYVRNPVNPVLTGAAWAVRLVLSLPLSAFVIRHWLAGDDAPEALVDQVREAVRSVRVPVLVSRVKQALHEDVAAEAVHCPVPILYLRAREDRLVSSSSESTLRVLRPDLTTIEMDGPHLILQRRPKEAVQAIEGFLRTALTQIRS
jgi:pimeloyl-ACP methyl ester carboxylesterase